MRQFMQSFTQCLDMAYALLTAIIRKVIYNLSIFLPVKWGRGGEGDTTSSMK